MKRKASKLALLICIIFTLSSCNKEDQAHNSVGEIKKAKSIEDEKKITLKELGYNSYEEMINDGWEVIHKTKGTELLNPPNTKAAYGLGTSRSNSGIKEKLTVQQVRDLGYSDYGLHTLYQVNSVLPDGIAVNDGSVGNPVYPLLSQRYGWHAYVTTGTPKISEAGLSKSKYTETTTWVTNKSDVADKLAKNIVYSESTKTSWTVSSTVGLKVGGKVGIPLVAEGSIEVSVGLTAGGGKEYTKTKSYSDTYTANLPPYSKRQIIFRQKITETAFNYEIPVDITGYVGLNFPSKVNGHYFWAYPASKLLKGKKNKQLGEINIENKLEVEVLAGPVIPL